MNGEEEKIQMDLRTFFKYLKGFQTEDVLAVYFVDRWVAVVRKQTSIQNKK